MRNVIISGLARIANFEWNPREKLWNRKAVAGTSLSAAGAMTILGQVFGISAVAHGSGAMILTGSAGYISGTFIAGTLIWIVWPLLVVVGLAALFLEADSERVRLGHSPSLFPEKWQVRRAFGIV